MDDDEVKRLQQHLGLPLPAAYRAYLAIAGSMPPPCLIGSDCHGTFLYKLRDGAIDLLREMDSPLSLPDDALVFFMHQGYQFFFICTADGIDDPEVFYYFEGRTSFEMSDDRFSDWVADIARS